MDKMTQKSKGYGFVTFKGMDGAHAALENPEKNIDVSLCPHAVGHFSALIYKKSVCRRRFVRHIGGRDFVANRSYTYLEWKC